MFDQRRMRKLRSQIAPIDGHARGMAIGSHVYQGRGVFTSPTTIEVIPHGKALGEESNPRLHYFRKAVIATGGRPYVPVAPSTNDDEATTATVHYQLESLQFTNLTTPNGNTRIGNCGIGNGTGICHLWITRDDIAAFVEIVGIVIIITRS